MRRHILLASAATLTVALTASAAYGQAGGGPATAGPTTAPPAADVSPPASNSEASAPPANGAPQANVGPQQVSTTLETITVTAQKRSENIQNVPLSITAVSGASLAAAGIEDPTSLQKLVPSLNVSTSTFGAGVAIRIRGFGSAANTATDPDVATYVDQAFVPRPGAILSSFLDVQSVEVLNGPQGTLFGRNSAMGAISINTNAPSFRAPSLDVTGEAGSYRTVAGTAVANMPVNDDFAVRLAVKGSHTGGVYFNELDGKTYGESDGFAGRLSAKWKITPDITWTVRLDGTKTDGDGANPLAVYTDTSTPAQLAALAAFNTRSGGSPQVYSSDPSYVFNQVFGNPSLHDHQYGVSSDLDWALSPKLTLRLLDSYRDWNNDQLTVDTVATSLNLLNVHETFESKAQSHELQLVSSKDAYLGGKLGFTAGLYYFHEDYNLNTAFNLGSQFCGLVYGGRPQTAAALAACTAGPQAGAGLAAFNQGVDSYAGYAQVDYLILPNLELDLGARESSDKKTASFTAVTPNKIGIAAVEGAEGPEGLSFKDSRPSVRASLSWHVTDRVMVFATYATGYKSGGFNSGPTGAPLGTAARTFQSETTEDYELGAKSVLWNGKLLFNADVFDTELNNFQDRSFNGSVFLIRNAGHVRSRGADLNGQIRVLPNLTLISGATYLDSIYTRNPTAPGLEGCVGPYVVGTVTFPGCPTVQNLSGRPIDYAPKWQGNGGFDWKIGTFSGGYLVSLAGTEVFSSSFLTANTDNPQSRVPGHYTTDLRLSLVPPGARWQFDIFGTNIFDKHFYTLAQPQTLGAVMGINNRDTGTTVFRGSLGDPGRFGVRLSAKF